MILTTAFNSTSGGFSFGSLLIVGAVGVAVGCFMILFPLALQFSISPIISSLVISVLLSLTAVFLAAAGS